MAAPDPDAEHDAIAALVRRQFACSSWAPGAGADWHGFADGFVADAVLYPARRPAAGLSVPEFVARMERVAAHLAAFEATLAGLWTRVFGNVAIAAAGCAIAASDLRVGRSVEMMLLVKTEGHWRIVAQAWDSEDADRPLPAALRGRRG